jgi:hypothetical protein
MASTLAEALDRPVHYDEVPMAAVRRGSADMAVAMGVNRNVSCS